MEQQAKNKSVQQVRELIQGFPLCKEFSWPFSHSVILVQFSHARSIALASPPVPLLLVTISSFLRGHQVLCKLRPRALRLRTWRKTQACTVIRGHGGGSRDVSMTRQKLRCNEMFAATAWRRIVPVDLQVVGDRPACTRAVSCGLET